MATWQDNLPEDIRDSGILGKYDDNEGALRALISANGQLSRSITIPGKDSGDDAWSKFDKKLDAHVEHLIRKPKDYSPVHENSGDYKLPEGVKIPADQLEFLRTEVALGGKWRQDQFDHFMKTMDTANVTAAAAQQALLDEDKAIITGKWGGAEEGINNSIKTLINQEQDEDNKFDDDEPMPAKFRLLLNNIVKLLRTETQGHQFPEEGAGMTPGEARERIANILTRLINETNMNRVTYKNLMKEKASLQRLVSKAA